MYLREIDGYFGRDSEASVQRSLMMAALSPVARREVLATSGMRLGKTDFFINHDGLFIRVAAEGPIPPVAWWNYEGAVSVSSNNSSVTACELIEYLKEAWVSAEICCVKMDNEDEIGEREQMCLLRTLHALSNDLVDLRLENFYLHDNDQLPFCRHLRSLVLKGFRGSLKKWSKILNSSAKQVEISDTVAFTEDSLAHIGGSMLYRLVLDNTNVTMPHLEQLKCARTLTTLSLVDCRRIDSFDAASFPKLRLLLLGRTPISSGRLTSVEECSHLRLINLGGCGAITDINVLGQLKELREVFVHETSVTNDGIAGLAECENLEKLNLGGCRFVSDVSHLGRLTALKELHLWSTRVTNAGVQGLCNCISLTELVLDDCIHITSVSPLALLPSLRWLSLIGTEVNTQGIRELIQCPNLETLALAGTRVENPPKLWQHQAIVEYLSGFQ